MKLKVPSNLRSSDIVFLMGITLPNQHEGAFICLDLAAGQYLFCNTNELYLGHF